MIIITLSLRFPKCPLGGQEDNPMKRKPKNKKKKPYKKITQRPMTGTPREESPWQNKGWFWKPFLCALQNDHWGRQGDNPIDRKTKKMKFFIHKIYQNFNQKSKKWPKIIPFWGGAKNTILGTQKFIKWCRV